MTPPPSSQAVDPAQAGDHVWSKRARMTRARYLRNAFMKDPDFQAMKPRARRLVKVLIIWHDPATGHLQIRTKNATLCEWCECSTSTLARARHDAIEAGFIVGYAPGDGGRGTGDGGWAGRYTIARTVEEATEARAARQAPDAPYWPPIPERERAPEPASQERRGRPPLDKPAPAARSRRARGNVAPPVSTAGQQPLRDVLPTPVSRYDPLPEDQLEIAARGAAAARAAMGLPQRAS